MPKGLALQYFLAANWLDAQAAEAQPCADKEAQLRIRLLKSQVEKAEVDAIVAKTQATAASVVPESTEDLLCDIRKRIKANLAKIFKGVIRQEYGHVGAAGTLAMPS